MRLRSLFLFLLLLFLTLSPRSLALPCRLFLSSFYQILGRRLPFRRLITRIQIIQFVASFVLATPMVVTHARLRSCAGIPALALSAFCNASYLALFLRFYRKAYRGGEAAATAGRTGKRD